MNTLNEIRTAVHIQRSNKKGWSFDAHNAMANITASGYASTPQQALQEALKVFNAPAEAKNSTYYDAPVDWDISITLIFDSEEKAWSYELFKLEGLTPKSIAFGFAPSPEKALEAVLNIIVQDK